MSDPASLSNCGQWLEEALEANLSLNSHQQPLIFLIGTKEDLINETTFEQVRQEAKNVASKLKAELWLVSSKSGKLVSDLSFRISVLAFEGVMARSKKSSIISQEIGALSKICFGRFSWCLIIIPF